MTLITKCTFCTSKWNDAIHFAIMYDVLIWNVKEPSFCIQSLTEWQMMGVDKMKHK